MAEGEGGEKGGNPAKFPWFSAISTLLLGALVFTLLTVPNIQEQLKTSFNLSKFLKADGGALELEDGGALELEDGGALELEDGGALEPEGGGALELEDGGALELEDGGALELEDGGALEPEGGGALEPEGGGALEPEGGGALDGEPQLHVSDPNLRQTEPTDAEKREFVFLYTGANGTLPAYKIAKSTSDVQLPFLPEGFKRFRHASLPPRSELMLFKAHQTPQQMSANLNARTASFKPPLLANATGAPRKLSMLQEGVVTESTKNVTRFVHYRFADEGAFESTYGPPRVQVCRRTGVNKNEIKGYTSGYTGEDVEKVASSEDCRAKAKAKGYIAYGYHTEQHPSEDHKNTCFFYNAADPDFQGNEGDNAHISACTDPSSHWGTGCHGPVRTTPVPKRYLAFGTGPNHGNLNICSEPDCTDGGNGVETQEECDRVAKAFTDDAYGCKTEAESGGGTYRFWAGASKCVNNGNDLTVDGVEYVQTASSKSHCPPETLSKVTECAASYNGGTTPAPTCCGQESVTSATVTDERYICPATRPHCVGYVHNQKWGTCETGETTPQCLYNGDQFDLACGGYVTKRNVWGVGSTVAQDKANCEHDHAKGGRATTCVQECDRVETSATDDGWDKTEMGWWRRVHGMCVGRGDLGGSYSSLEYAQSMCEQDPNCHGVYQDREPTRKFHKITKKVDGNAIPQGGCPQEQKPTDAYVYLQSKKTGKNCTYTHGSSRPAHGSDRKHIYCDHEPEGPHEVFRFEQMGGNKWKMFTGNGVDGVAQNTVVQARHYPNDSGKHHHILSFSGDVMNNHDGTFEVVPKDNYVCLKSTHNNKFCAVENDHVKHGIRCDRDHCQDWEPFKVSYAPGNQSTFPVPKDPYPGTKPSVTYVLDREVLDRHNEHMTNLIDYGAYRTNEKIYEKNMRAYEKRIENDALQNADQTIGLTIDQMIRANPTRVFEHDTFNGQSATLSAELTHQNLGQELALPLRTDGQRLNVSSVEVGRGFVLRLVQKDTGQTYTQYELTINGPAQIRSLHGNGVFGKYVRQGYDRQLGDKFTHFVLTQRDMSQNSVFALGSVRHKMSCREDPNNIYCDRAPQDTPAMFTAEHSGVAGDNMYLIRCPSGKYMHHGTHPNDKVKCVSKPACDGDACDPFYFQLDFFKSARDGNGATRIRTKNGNFPCGVNGAKVLTCSDSRHLDGDEERMAVHTQSGCAPHCGL
jgi:hypothetical protein